LSDPEQRNPAGLVIPTIAPRISAARSQAECDLLRVYPFLKGKTELNFLQAMRWFRSVGLEEVEAQTFVGDVQAPPQWW
jgi:hypothetical protein